MTAHRAQPIQRIWFWQRYVSPHTVDLMRQLAGRGIDVTLVSCAPMDADRRRLGWEDPDLHPVRHVDASDPGVMQRTAATCPLDAVHIVSGLRGNGLLPVALAELARRRARLWIWLETVENRGLGGLARRILYHLLLRRWAPHVKGFLAAGYRLPAWLRSRGAPGDRIFEFAYFLPPSPRAHTARREADDTIEFLFVGQMIRRKCLPLLIAALTALAGVRYRLTVVGTGPLEASLSAQAHARLGSRVNWLGQRAIGDIPAIMAAADYLILPSRHDGWGAVVNEALIAGTGVICSDCCGAGGIALASGAAALFRAGRRSDLYRALRWAVARGKQSPERRGCLASWAHCVTGPAGASYLLDILACSDLGAPAPIPPWRAAGPAFAAGNNGAPSCA